MIYAAAKAGVTGPTRALAVELGKEGITVNCICPGPINTGMTAAIPAADKETFANRRTALRRYGDPAEVAHVTTLSLCLPRRPPTSPARPPWSTAGWMAFERTRAAGGPPTSTDLARLLGGRRVTAKSGRRVE